MSPESLGKLIKRVRKSAGITQVEVSKYVGISQSAFSKIEAGHLAVGFREMILICEAIGLPLVTAKRTLMGDEK
jgi:transcriptional regulator with XRE-family HTH domain